MKFSLVDADGEEIEHERYLLSLKDMNQSDHLLELIEAGATSFKIEGRLKDVAYVKNVTAAYSQRLDAIIRQHPGLYCRASQGRCDYTFTPDLNRTFNRGYTTYFLHGRQPNIASFDTPKAIGEFVGTVKEIRGDSFNVAGVASFAGQHSWPRLWQLPWIRLKSHWRPVLLCSGFHPDGSAARQFQSGG